MLPFSNNTLIFFNYLFFGGEGGEVGLDPRSRIRERKALGFCRLSMSIKAHKRSLLCQFIYPGESNLTRLFGLNGGLGFLKGGRVYYTRMKPAGLFQQREGI
jgi:hypothetical protein